MPDTAIITPGTLTQGFCPQTEQQRLNAYAANLTVTLPAGSEKVLKQAAAPAPEERDKVWFQIDDAKNLIRAYTFSDSFAKWVSPHPVPAGSSLRQIWVGDAATLWQFDGGDGQNPTTTAPTSTTGAMWEIDPIFAGRFLVAAGPLGSSTVGVNETVGSASFTIAKENLPNEGADLPDQVIGQPGDQKGAFSLNGDNGSDFKYVPATAPLGDGKEIEHVPPCYGVYVIKRTARMYYTA